MIQPVQPPHFRRAGLSLLLLLAVGCGGRVEGSDAATDGATDAGPTATHITFQLSGTDAPPYGEIPWPSDLYLDADGTLVDDIDFSRLVAANSNVLAAALAPLNGAGRTTAVFFYADGPIDPDSLPADAAASISATATAAMVALSSGERIGLHPRYVVEVNAIALQPEPGQVLAPGEQYAVVVTTGVTSRGAAIEADTDLAAILAMASPDRSSPAELLYGNAADELLSLGVVSSTDEIAGLAVFTTHSGEEDLLAMREIIADPAQYPPPQPSFDALEIAPFKPFLAGATGTTPTLDEWLGIPDQDMAGLDWPGGDNAGGRAHDAIGAVLTGAYPSAGFMASNGHVVPDDGSGPPELVGTPWVPITFIFPAAPAADPAGYPVVMFGHGFGGDRGSALYVANELCRAGYVVVAIDYYSHGTRDSTVDDTSLLPGTYSGPDGFADISSGGMSFYGLFDDFLLLRDKFRQTTADLLAVIQMTRNPALDLSAAAPALGFTPALNGDELFWYGGSFGGMFGSILAAYAPEVRAFVLGVPGGGFIHLLASNSRGFVGVVELALGLVFGAADLAPINSWHPIGNLLEQALEPGTVLVNASRALNAPLAVGGAAPSARNILMFYALDDETMPNLATDALIEALGIPVMEPYIRDTSRWGRPYTTLAGPISGNVMGGFTAGALQYAPASHGLPDRRFGTRSLRPGHPFDDEAERFPELAAEITLEIPIREVLQGAIHFFDTATGGGTAEIISTAAPADDFDGDGVSDMDEMTAGTDPFDPTSF